MAGVDDTEPVALGVGEHDEVGVVGVVPRHSNGADADEAFDLGRLLVATVDDEVDMYAWMIVGMHVRSMDRDARSFAVGRHQNRELILGVFEAHRVEAEHARPERHRSRDVGGAEDHRSKSKHERDDGK